MQSKNKTNNPENDYTRELISVMQAQLDGKPIECKTKNASSKFWYPFTGVWNFVDCEYRVKKPINLFNTEAYRYASRIRAAINSGFGLEYVSMQIANYANDLLGNTDIRKENDEIIEMQKEYQEPKKN